MENQHRKITGYRDLSQAEIDLMNKIKAAGKQLNDLVVEAQKHISDQVNAGDVNEQMRLAVAEPMRWVAIARTDLQTGLMALTRAVAQPGSF